MKKAITFIIAALILGLLLTGCDEAKLIRKNELLAKTKTWKEPKVAIWYYVGSDEKFDYFVNIDLNQFNSYKVTKHQIEKEQEFPITKDQSKWLVMPWGPIASQ